MGYFKILATDSKTGEEFICFHWRGTETVGVSRARLDCAQFGRKAHGFRAVQIDDDAHTIR